MNDSNDDAGGAVERMLDEMPYQTDLLGRGLPRCGAAPADACGATHKPRESRVFEEALGRRAYTTLASSSLMQNPAK